MDNYDVVIVGARCAGSPLAMLLARKGYRVVLLDRAHFPSDTMSTHIVWPPGMARLRRWGLHDEVAASNCPQMTGIGFDLGAFALHGTPPPVDGAAGFYAPRRTILDKILADAAVEAGAELRQDFPVDEILAENGRFTGVRGHTPSGQTAALFARIVVGADGMRSVVARSVGAKEYNSRPPLTCWYYSYWDGVPASEPIWYAREDKLVGAVPTNDGLTAIITVWKNARFHEFRRDIEQNFLATVDLVPELSAHVRAGRRHQRFVGTADLPNYFRRSHGPGWALVGDAGYHKDPVTGQGITDAFCDAEALSEAIDEGLSGRRPLNDALADYEHQRNARVTPMYELTCQIASLDPPPPEMQALYAALRTNENARDRFFGTLAGTVSIPEFYAPESIQRIVGRGPARGPIA